METYTTKYHKNGDIYSYLNNKLHSMCAPAIVYKNGTKIWYRNGLRHRDVGPAIEEANGRKYWYINGKLIKQEN